MSKKVVIISASPRKGGNSDTLCEEFRRGCEEAGNQVVKISLRDKQINFCPATTAKRRASAFSRTTSPPSCSR